MGCFAYLPVYKKICPYCGAEAPPAAESQDLPQESEEKLRMLVGSPEEMRRMYFDMKVKIARSKGYKPGFASAQYKGRYGTWPPWGWSEETKASFASDPEWQANYEANQKRRAKIDAAKVARELAKIEDPDDDES